MSDHHESILRLLKGIAALGRADVYSAFNIGKGKGYSAIKEPVTDQVIERHACNRQPIAIYLFEGSETHLAALDVDVHGGEMPWPDVTAKISPLIEALIAQGLRPLVVRSGGGSGIHLWFAWEQPQLTRLVRRKLERTLRSQGFKNGTKGLAEGSIEIYPKQDSVPKGKLGNVIALPFARKSVPLDESLMPISLDAYEPPDLQDLFSNPLPADNNDDPEEVKTAPRQRSQAPSFLGLPLDGDLEEVASALRHIPADDHDLWVRIGLAIKHTFGEAGYSIWAAWSQTVPAKFPGEAECRAVWEGFEPSGEVGLGSLFHEAKKEGWNGPSDPVIREMNAQYGIYTNPSKTMILLKDPTAGGEDGIAWLSKTSFIDRLAGQYTTVEGPDGKQSQVHKAKFWLGHRKAAQYHRITFDPNLRPGHNGNAWNIWTGFAVEPHTGKWDLLQDHIRVNICGGDQELFEWTMNWLALGVRQPGYVIGTAPVLHGLPGTGKGVFANAYGSLWGRHYTTITHESHVTGRFNAHLFGRRFVFIDEGTFGGNRREAGVIKTRVTEPKIMLEAKGVDPIWIDNHMIIMIASNEKSIVPADIGDRRWQVFEVADDRREDQTYFGAIAQELNQGGREAMLHDLLHRDISVGPDPRKTIRTAGLFEQIMHAAGPEVRYLFQVLDEGALPQPDAPGNGPGVTTIKALYQGMRESQASAHYVQMTMFGKLINKMFPDARTVPSGTYIDPRSSLAAQERSTRYNFPPLADCRSMFEAYVRQSIPWSNDIEDWQGGLNEGGGDEPF